MKGMQLNGRHESQASHNQLWPLAFILLLHILIQIPHLQIDFWNDELYSLEQFVLKPARVAVTDYHSTNNHVFFSILSHYWAQCFGINGLKEAIVNVPQLRILSLLCSCTAIAFTYCTARTLGLKHVAWLPALLLATSIPFYNYAAQMRGYSLSMCLFAGLIYTAVLGLAKGVTILRWLAIVLLSMLTLYTLPSNLYFIVTAILLIALYVLLNGRGSNSGRFSRHAVMAIAAISVGTIAAACLYLPLLSQMRRLPILSSGSSANAFETLLMRMPITAYHFLSGRYLLLIPVAISIAAGYKRACQPIILICVFFFTPFLLADLRANSTPFRVFLTGLPLLCLGMGYAVAEGIAVIRSRKWQLAAFTAVAVYCTVTFGYQIRKSRAAALGDIRRGDRSVDLYVQYNLHYFQPQADANTYLQQYARPAIPLVEACRMDEEVLKYLSWAGWDRTKAKQLILQQAYHAFDTIDVLTEQPAALNDSLRPYRSQFSTRQLLPGERSVQIIRVVKSGR